MRCPSRLATLLLAACSGKEADLPGPAPEEKPDPQVDTGDSPEGGAFGRERYPYDYNLGE